MLEKYVTDLQKPVSNENDVKALPISNENAKLKASSAGSSRFTLKFGKTLIQIDKTTNEPRMK